MHRFFSLVTFILLCNISFAVGTEGLVNTPAKKVGFLKKMQHRILIKKLNKLLAKVDTTDHDLIQLYSGKILNAYVLDVQKNRVRYKNIDLAGSEIETLTCQEVDHIVLNDGTIYECSHPTKSKRSARATFKIIEELIREDEYEEQEAIAFTKQQCDILTLYNGTTTNVKVLEINNKKIIFEPCEGPDIFVDSLSCKEVDVLTLADGTSYTCSHPNLPKRSPEANFSKISSNSPTYQHTSECDLLILMNKDQLDVQIEAIKDEQIFYKPCRDSSAATKSIHFDELRTYRTKEGYGKRINQYHSEIVANANGNKPGLPAAIKVLLVLALTTVIVLLVTLIAILLSF